MPKSHPRRNAPKGPQGRFKTPSSDFCVGLAFPGPPAPERLASPETAHPEIRRSTRRLRMAVGQPRQRDLPALLVQKPRRRRTRRRPCRSTVTATPAVRAACCEGFEARSPGSRTGSRNRRRRTRSPRRRQCRAPASPRPPPTTGCSAHRSRPTRRRPRTVWQDPRPDRRTRPSPHGRDRAPLLPARCAAAAPGSARPAPRAPRRRPRGRGRRAALKHIEAERGVADRAGDHDAIARLGAAAVDHPACGHPPERGDRDHQRARRRNRVAAEQRTAELDRILAQPARERLSARPPRRLAQRQRQHEARGRRPLGGEIGQVHPQRLARDGVGRIVGQKMHAFDDGVRRHHDVVAMRP